MSSLHAGWNHCKLGWRSENGDVISAMQGQMHDGTNEFGLASTCNRTICPQDITPEGDFI